MSVLTGCLINLHLIRISSQITERGVTVTINIELGIFPTIATIETIDERLSHRKCEIVVRRYRQEDCGVVSRKSDHVWRKGGRLTASVKVAKKCQVAPTVLHDVG
jgi:hypothetical protein